MSKKVSVAVTCRSTYIIGILKNALACMHQTDQTHVKEMELLNSMSKSLTFFILVDFTRMEWPILYFKVSHDVS